MLEDKEKAALKKWYTEERVLTNAKRLIEQKDFLQLEEYIHKTALIPLGKHAELPKYMLDDEGKTLFPDNLDPRVDEEGWQDAIELGWAVIGKKLGVSHDDVHQNVATEQDRDWNAFIKSVEQRKKERGLE